MNDESEPKLGNDPRFTPRRPGVPAASDHHALKRMKSTRRRDTAAETAVQEALRRLGLTFEVDRSPLPGLRRRADLVFERERVAVYVDGCFWHACPLHATWPKQNAGWWREKIQGNQRRDRDTDHRLNGAGWHVVRVWEHEDPYIAAERISVTLAARANSVSAVSEQ